MIKNHEHSHNKANQYNAKPCAYFARHTVCAGIIIGMGSANERRRYNVTPALIDRAHTQNVPSCIMPISILWWLFVLREKLFTFKHCLLNKQCSFVYQVIDAGFHGKLGSHYETVVFFSKILEINKLWIVCPSWGRIVSCLTVQGRILFRTLDRIIDFHHKISCYAGTCCDGTSSPVRTRSVWYYMYIAHRTSLTRLIISM